MSSPSILSTVDEVLAEAGIYAAPKRPNPLPRQAFVVFFANGGGDPTPVTEQTRIELEAWAESLTEAEALLDQARDALHEATGSSGIRRVENVSWPADLGTDEREWERFAAAVQITTRPNRRYLT